MKIDGPLATVGKVPEPLDGFLTFFDPGWSIVRLRDTVAQKGEKD